MVYIWVLDGWDLGTGIALPPTHPATAPRVHPSLHPLALAVADPAPRRAKCGRGAQIGSSTHFKGYILRVKRYYRGL